MTLHMPQEIEVWYVLPALRRELAKIFINTHHLSQKEVASILGLTESAISQYVKSKRANELKFSEVDLKKIQEGAENILNDRKNAAQYFYNLTLSLRGSKTMCELHKKMDSAIPHDCKICSDEQLFPLGKR
jgi:predicted transcriptional regulator